MPKYRKTSSTLAARSQFKRPRRVSIRRGSVVHRVMTRRKRRATCHPELKLHQYLIEDVTLVVPAAAIGGTLLTNISNGDTNTTRDGNRIWAKGAHCRITLYQNPLLPDAQLFRFIVVKRIGVSLGDIAAPQLTDILQDPTRFTSFRRIGSGRLFKILVDRTLHLPVGTGFTAAGPSYIVNLAIRQVRIRIPIYGNVEWVDGTGTNVRANHIYYWMIGSELGNGTLGLWSMEMMFRYTDS